MDVLHVDVVLLPVLARRVGRVELAVCWARSTSIPMIDQHLQFYRYVHRIWSKIHTLSENTIFAAAKALSSDVRTEEQKVDDL